MDLQTIAHPTVDARLCSGCGRCAAVCPDEVPQIEEGRLCITEGVFLGCIGCGQCVCVCPTGAIRVEGRGMKADDAVELSAPEARATAVQLEALLLARRSVRRFTAQEVDRTTVDRILEMTSMAPMGIPPSEVGVVVFHGREKVRRFAAEACACFGRGARFLNPVVLTLMRPFLGAEQHRMMRDFVRPLLETLAREHAAGRDRFTFDAPLAMLFHAASTGDPADAHIAATYAMLAAESLGLGGCLLGTAAGLQRDAGFRARHNIPPSNKIGLALAMGHPAVRFTRAVRRRLASVDFA